MAKLASSVMSASVEGVLVAGRNIIACKNATNFAARINQRLHLSQRAQQRHNHPAPPPKKNDQGKCKGKCKQKSQKAVKAKSGEVDFADEEQNKVSEDEFVQTQKGSNPQVFHSDHRIFKTQFSRAGIQPSQKCEEVQVATPNRLCPCHVYLLFHLCNDSSCRPAMCGQCLEKRFELLC